MATPIVFLVDREEREPEALSEALRRRFGGDYQVRGDRSPTAALARLERPPLRFEASLPGVFAAGDVRHGSVKRVATAVGEGAAAVQLVHDYLNDQVE